MRKIFAINGSISTEKECTEQQYEQFKALVAALPKCDEAALSVQDTACPVASESFDDIDVHADFNPLHDFVNTLQNWIQPPANIPPPPASVEQVFAKYGLTPADNPQANKDSLSSLNDDDFYNCTKELFYVIEATPTWDTFRSLCDSHNDFRVNPAAYRAELQSLVFLFIDNNGNGS